MIDSTKELMELFQSFYNSFADIELLELEEDLQGFFKNDQE